MLDVLNKIFEILNKMCGILTEMLDFDRAYRIDRGFDRNVRKFDLLFNI